LFFNHDLIVTEPAGVERSFTYFIWTLELTAS